MNCVLSVLCVGQNGKASDEDADKYTPSSHPVTLPRSVEPCLMIQESLRAQKTDSLGTPFNLATLPHG